MLLALRSQDQLASRRNRRAADRAATPEFFQQALYTAGIAFCAVEEDWTMSESESVVTTDVVATLPDTLLKAYTEVCAVIENLRESRDVLHKTTASRIQHTTAKLEEVSSATEQAATGILDGLDRSIALVDKLETLDASGSEEAGTVRGQLRDELFMAQGALQFQDITSQQLKYAGSILVDMEQRLADVAQSLDTAAIAGGARVVRARTQKTVELAFDPGATMSNADVRQALADAIFTPRVA